MISDASTRARWPGRGRPLGLVILAGLLAGVACGEKSPLKPESEPVVTSIEVLPSEAAVTALGETRGFGAIARDQDGRTMSGVQFLWSSSDSRVATVGENGLATAKGVGRARILASAAGVTGAAVLSVEQKVADLQVTPDSVTFTALGSAQQFSASARDANGFEIVGAGFQWASSDESVASVDSTGLVTASAEGQATISASLDGLTDAGAVSVTQVPMTVQLSLEAITLTALDDTYQLSATARDGNGNPVSAASIDWASSDDRIVTVDAAGLVTAVGDGIAWVIAAVGNLADTATVTVSRQVAGVQVTPSAVLLDAVGEATNLTASAYDANGHAMSSVSFDWTSSNTGVATVDGGGWVTAMGPGSAQVTASAAGFAGTAAVSVQVEDSVVFDLGDIVLLDEGAQTEASLGSFAIPAHIAELGVAVYVEITLSGTEQNDESFAIGAVGQSGVEFIGNQTCPVVVDDPSLGRAWVFVGDADLSAATVEFIARHAILFGCYVPNDNFNTLNSIHINGIKFVYWRGE